MFQKGNKNNSDPKSDIDRLCAGPSEVMQKMSDLSSQERITANSTSRQSHSQNNCLGNNSNEEIKSQQKIRTLNNPNSSCQYSQATHHQEMQQQPQQNSNGNHLNQRKGNHIIRSTTTPQLYQASPSQHSALSSHPTFSSKSAITSDYNTLCGPTRQLVKQREPLMNMTRLGYHQHSRDDFKLAYEPRMQEQQERDSDEVVIKEELEKLNLDGFKESDLETLSSLERSLPVELSFLIRQQAFCMARMNYLDRQIRELKETNKHAVSFQQSPSTSVNQSHTIRTNAASHIKNGNFIPSDDSGGEYSRATISDEDELSSLLDQIAKSVRPVRNIDQNVSNNQQRANHSVISNQPQQYAILHSNQLHHQAVPVLLMGSPIAVAHPSSISSNVLPGVHFQPEARYNQYYEDFYVHNGPSSSSINRQNGIRSQQFDSNISAIEQRVSQKEKRQFKNQLETADNWLKMRFSDLYNLNNNFSNNNNNSNNDNTNSNSKKRTTLGAGLGDLPSGSVSEKNLLASSSSGPTQTGNPSSVIEGNRNR